MACIIQAPFKRLGVGLGTPQDAVLQEGSCRSASHRITAFPSNRYKLDRPALRKGAMERPFTLTNLETSRFG
jgi:hypothetical protein